MQTPEELESLFNLVVGITEQENERQREEMEKMKNKVGR